MHIAITRYTLVFMLFFFPSATITYHLAEPNTNEAFGLGLDEVPIHLDQVSCLGNERGLIDCSHDGLGVHNCFHFEDIGIVCSK